MNENALREHMVEIGKSLYERGLAHGSAGNLSVRLDDGWLMTPTNSCLGRLDPSRLSRLDPSGRLLAGDRPSKETFLHLAMYRERACGAVVHLHSVHAVAVSCLADVDPESVFPPLTAYAIMQLGRLALAPYYPPGDESLAEAVRNLAGKHHAILLANHGPVVAGATLDAAVNAIEELEQTAKLMLLLRGQPLRLLTSEQVAELNRRFSN
ncbi:MAG TPA: 3-oxo-tetronate 4-phosphate decarboxylase [Burkholderiales bacterium]|jgi:ribulose-5-phosphate 4-epimerase/fuculose-1-phosphate aldolase|nr:3-oxo-tetronate 4-phosphate decarboxylase [Burkholderiales bacterium]